MKAQFARFSRSRGGAALTDFALMVPVLVIVLGVLFDFTLAVWQWNAAIKALERGARIATTSGPLAPTIANANAIDSACQGGTCAGGESYYSTPVSYRPDFKVTCSGSTGNCVCTPGTLGGAEACTDIGATTAISTNALRWIVFGRGQTGTTCPTNVSGSYNLGMCHFLRMITSPLVPGNVQVIYKTSNLGFYNRPTGPVMTITVQFDPANPPQFKFFFLSYIFNRVLLNLSRQSTLTSEDLSCGSGGC